MKIILDNAQHTPHVDFIDNQGKIIAQLSICKDGLLATGDLGILPALYPKTDGIILFETSKEIHPDWLKEEK